jgi:hypothetical protein
MCTSLCLHVCTCVRKRTRVYIYVCVYIGGLVWNWIMWLEKCTRKYFIILLLPAFTKIVRNEGLHIQCTTHNALIPVFKLAAGLNSNIAVNRKEYFMLVSFRETLNLFIKNNNSVALVREGTIPTERPPLADRGCRVVSAVDPYGCNLRFLDQSSWFVLTRLSGPRFGTTTSQNIS